MLGPSAVRSTRRTTAGLRRRACGTTAFTSPPLCSPTRAALLTGRNSHAVGFGSVGEFSTGFPGYTAFVPDDCVPFPRILRDNGYSTSAFGKWHLTPDGQQGPAGPFDRWPVGWGFDYFYGFLGGGSGQWDPCLDREPEDHRHARTPTTTTARTPITSPTTWPTRRSSGCTRSAPRTPTKPFFTYFSTGCSHAPHHVSEDWAEKYKGRFDQGWDELRTEIFERQKEARRRSRRRGADTSRRRVPRLGRRSREAQGLLRASDGGLRRLLRERRPQRRSGDRRGRGAR